MRTGTALTLGSAHPLCASSTPGLHAVTRVDTRQYCYNKNGDMVISPGRTIQWSPFGKPVRIDRGSGNTVVEFEYGRDRSRTRRIDQKVGGTETTTTYVGSYEKEVRADKTIERYSIAGIAIITRETSTESGNTVTTTKEQYLLRDTLGSVVGILDRTTLDYNSLLASSSTYDAWGQRRHLDGTPFTTAELFADANGDITNRGFTGHEQVDGVGLIHMNGRMYDLVIGRFISADPVMQDPTDYQNLNRYSYVRNNPLTLIDPSGFSWWSKKGRGIFAKVFAAFFPTVAISTPQGLKEFGRFARKNKYVAEVTQIAGCVASAIFAQPAAPYICGGISAGTTYGVTDGDIGAAARAGAIAYASASVATWIGDQNFHPLIAAMGHGYVGGAASVANGGDFGAGFTAGVLGSLTGGVTKSFVGSGTWYQTVIGSAVQATIGGTISKLSGGGFANGARTSAFVYLFNDLAHDAQKGAAITDAELALAKEGKFLEFWRSRHLAGDPVARTALTGWGDPDFVGASLFEKLAAGHTWSDLSSYISDNGLTVSMEQIGAELALAHANAVIGDGRGIANLLSPTQVADYHHSVFRGHGIPAHIFGGTHKVPFVSVPVQGGWGPVMFDANTYSGLWCKGCDSTP